MSISSPNNTLHPDGTVKIRKAKNLWKPSDWAQANMSVEWSLPLHKCLVVGFPKQLSVLDHSHGLPPSLATSSLFSSLVPLLHPFLNDRGTSFLDPSSLPSPHICVCVCVWIHTHTPDVILWLLSLVYITVPTFALRSKPHSQFNVFISVPNTCKFKAPNWTLESYPIPSFLVFPHLRK